MFARGAKATVEQQSRYSPMGFVAVVKAKELGAETKRKGFDLDPAPAGDQKMAELVEENHQARDKKKRQTYSASDQADANTDI